MFVLLKPFLLSLYKPFCYKSDTYSIRKVIPLLQVTSTVQSCPYGEPSAFNILFVCSNKESHKWPPNCQTQRPFQSSSGIKCSWYLTVSHPFLFPLLICIALLWCGPPLPLLLPLAPLPLLPLNLHAPKISMFGPISFPPYVLPLCTFISSHRFNHLQPFHWIVVNNS